MYSINYILKFSLFHGQISDPSVMEKKKVVRTLDRQRERERLYQAIEATNAKYYFHHLICFYITHKNWMQKTSGLF